MVTAIQFPEDLQAACGEAIAAFKASAPEP